MAVTQEFVRLARATIIIAIIILIAILCTSSVGQSGPFKYACLVIEARPIDWNGSQCKVERNM